MKRKDAEKLIKQKYFPKAKKLNPVQVLEIRELQANGVTQIEIAKMYKISPGMVSHIMTGTYWSDVVALKG